MFGKTPLPATEQRSVQLDDHLVAYTLKRSKKRRSIGLRIDNKGLTVHLPLRASDKWLQQVLQNKADWIVQKLANWKLRQPQPQQWLTGSALPFRGEQLTLHVIDSLFEAEPEIRDRHLFVYLATADDSAADQQVAKRVTHWYRQQALLVFEECAAHFAPQLKVTPRQIKLSDARTQWGSCTTQGIVRLNWRLVKMPLHLIDYVVVHELAHLIEMNHSTRFWQLVESVCPNYRQCRAELRAIGISE